MRTILIAIAGIAVIGGIVFFVEFGNPPGESPMPVPSVEGVSRPHVVDDSSIGLDRIRLVVVYFVPADVIPWEGWRERIVPALQEMEAFHRLQFRGSSELVHEIYTETIVGERDSAFYDGSDTARGNPHAWEAVREELNRRLGALRQDDGAFDARLVLFEGVGAVGGVDQILVSSGYLQSPVEMPRASAVFYHELGHVFGLKDAYTYEHGAPLDEDIMGLGRNRPIGQTYLSEKAKKELGIR
ncbi:MAG: hypothetical protein Q8Q39_01065 [bacterium]|nr:hypothetical protein [bacterium]